MDSTKSLPTWPDLFGSPDTKEADAGRSVTAPAAYLADLLQLLEDRFDPSDFRNRRPDITAQILLNGKQSFSLVRQLDITNRVLGDKITSSAKKNADDVLAGAQHPFWLPFEYQHERIRQLLLLLRTAYRDLQSSCAVHVDIDVLAKERLGLSPARAAAVVRDLSNDSAPLRSAYGLEEKISLSTLADLDSFRTATQLDATSMQQLLYSQLSQSSGISGGISGTRSGGRAALHQP